MNKTEFAAAVAEAAGASKKDAENIITPFWLRLKNRFLKAIKFSL